MPPDQILETIRAAIAAKFPEWTASTHSPFRDQIATPAMLLECEAGNPSDTITDGAGRIWVAMDLSVKIALSNMDQNATAAEALNACADLSQFVSGNTWDLPHAAPAEWRGFTAEPFIDALDHVAYWSVNWTQEFLLGEEDPITIHTVDELYLGESPNIGPGNEDQYTQAHP